LLTCTVSHLYLRRAETARRLTADGASINGG